MTFREWMWYMNDVIVDVIESNNKKIRPRNIQSTAKMLAKFI